MHPRDERAITQVVGHVDALLVLVPASASAASLGVYLTPNERRVLVLLRHKERFVRKLLALEEPVAVFVEVALEIGINGRQALGQLGSAPETCVFHERQLNR